MKTLLDEPGISDFPVHFRTTSAIRYNKSLLVHGKVADESMYACPDEGWACPGTNANGSIYVTCGCPYTAWVECGLEALTSWEDKVDFIACWDEQGLEDKKQDNTTMEAAAKNCSEAIGRNFSNVKTCWNDFEGRRADLLFAAANRFMEKWPEFVNMSGPFHVPHVLMGTCTDLSSDNASCHGSSEMEDMQEDSDAHPINATLDIPRFLVKLCSLGVKSACAGAFADVSTV